MVPSPAEEDKLFQKLKLIRNSDPADVISPDMHIFLIIAGEMWILENLLKTSLLIRSVFSSYS